MVMVGTSPCRGLSWLCCSEGELDVFSFAELSVLLCSHAQELFAACFQQIMLYYCLGERRKAKIKKREREHLVNLLFSDLSDKDSSKCVRSFLLQDLFTSERKATFISLFYFQYRF